MKEQPTDSRGIFGRFAARKPSKWSECPERELNEFEAKIIADLPVIETDAVTPMHDMFDYDNPPLECIVKHKGSRYYVNTEGYSYARYAFKIAERKDGK